MHILRKFKVPLFLALLTLVFGLAKVALADGIILKDLNGRDVNLSSIKNKPVILFFWTTWCPYCRKEIKSLNQLYPQLKKEGINLLAINIGESDYKVKRFFKDYVLSFNVLLDKEARLADQYDVVGVPTYVLLNKTGMWVAHDNALPLNYKELLLK